MSDISTNYLEFFKENSGEHRFDYHRGENKIFLHHHCEDNNLKAYGIRSLNKILEEKVDKDSLLSRIISMIHALQEGIDKGFGKEGLGKYEHASTDYPKIYDVIVSGISERALETISNHKMDIAPHIYPENLGKQVVERLNNDREKVSIAEAKTTKSFREI